jgi:hypothetical protein
MDFGNSSRSRITTSIKAGIKPNRTENRSAGFGQFQGYSRSGLKQISVEFLRLRLIHHYHSPFDGNFPGPEPLRYHRGNGACLQNRNDCRNNDPYTKTSIPFHSQIPHIILIMRMFFSTQQSFPSSSP